MLLFLIVLSLNKNPDFATDDIYLWDGVKYKFYTSSLLSSDSIEKYQNVHVIIVIDSSLAACIACNVHVP